MVFRRIKSRMLLLNIFLLPVNQKSYAFIKHFPVAGSNENAYVCMLIF